MGFIKLFKKLDLLGDPVQFNIKGREIHKTIPGSVFTILTLVIYFTVTIYNIVITYTDYQPTITSVSLSRDFSVEQTIPRGNFNFSMAFYEVSQSFKKIDLPKTYTSEISHQKIILFPYTEENQYIGQFKKCDELEAEYYVGYLDGHLPYTQMKTLEEGILCDDIENDLVLGGDFLYNYKRNSIEAKIKFDTCELEGVSSDDCSSLIKLEEFSTNNNLHWAFSYSDTELNPHVSLGYTHFADYIEQEFNLASNHRVEIIFTKNTLETDNNLIFNFMANEVQEFYTFEVTYVEVERLENLTQMEIIFDISFSRFEKNHTRSYEKLDSVLANIQAVTAIIDWLFAMMLGYFNSNSMEKYLANKVYLVQNSNSNINGYVSLKKSHNRQSSVITNVPFNNMNANNTNNNNDQSFKVELKNRKDDKLEIKSDANRNDNSNKDPGIIEIIIHHQ